MVECQMNKKVVKSVYIKELNVRRLLYNCLIKLKYIIKNSMLMKIIEMFTLFFYIYNRVGIEVKISKKDDSLIIFNS